MKILGIQCYQDYNVTYYDTETNELKYIELDKFLKVKHFSLHSSKLNYLSYIDNVYKDNMRNNLFKIQSILKEKFNIDKIDIITWCYQNFKDGYLKLESYQFYKLMTKTKFVKLNHQENHILPSIFINDLINDDVLCLSIDGKGDGNHSIFLYKDKTLKTLYHETSFSYGMFYEILSSNFLNCKYYNGIEGKFMAYAGISTNFVNIPNIKVFFRIIKKVNWNVFEQKQRIEQYINDYINNLKLKYDEYDLAYTFQILWINDIMNFLQYYSQFSDKLIFSGGCAMNCLLNYHLLKSGLFKHIYFNPIASDSGQSFGTIYNYFFKKNKFNVLKQLKLKQYDCTNDIYDKSYFDLHIQPKLKHIDNDKIIDYLYNDKIIGICRGKLEMGPRALGNRSIIASPFNKDMHDKLNIIKNREWYRPYGIIIPREYLNDYFDIDVDAPYMNIIAYCKFNNLLNGTTHFDGTTRIQTINKNDNPWLHDLLIDFGKKSGHPILINTSFNDNGLPTFNYSSDMYRLFDESLDGIIFDNGMILS